MVLAVPVLRRFALTAYRFGLAIRHLSRPFKYVPGWLIKSRETTNFTYDLAEANRRYLAAFLADATGVGYATIAGYLDEIDADQELREHVRMYTARSTRRELADKVVRFGRRVGWFALVRAVKPRLVVETGVDKGYGSCVLTAALRHNAQEGHPGRYIGTDIDPEAGYLLAPPYDAFGRILYGDSISSLRALTQKIDVFINDSDHSPDYEAEEYRTVAGLLGPESFVIGDNAHATPRLLEFALQTGRTFVFFPEVPKDHWYPGGGIGLAFFRRR
jgi:hypothetical protein